MRKAFLLFLFLSGITFGNEAFGSASYYSFTGLTRYSNQEDSLQKLQLLYRGVIWTNKYHRFVGDQFFLTPLFVPGIVSINGHAYKNLRIKYDIYSDELVTPVNSEEIIQMNKEMIDSFSLTFENKTYRFVNFQNDTVSGLDGYCNLLCSGNTSLYVKYIKTISTAVTIQVDGEFNQIYKIFLVTNGVISQIKNKKEMLEILYDKKDQLNEFIKKNRIRISRFDPESFLPVIKYYNTIKNKI